MNEKYMYRIIIQKISFDNSLDSIFKRQDMSQNFVENVDKEVLKDILYRMITEKFIKKGGLE